MTNPPCSEFRVALIGYGLGGASFHAPLIATTPGLRLSTIVTSSGERQSQAAAAHPGATIVPTAEHVWQAAAKHEVVVISTPNRTHASLALQALAAGLPVVIDKPFATTAAEAARIIEAARSRGLWVSPYHIRRWDSELLTLRKLIQAGDLGEVLRFESRLERWRPVPKGGWRERAAPQEAGGLLYDLGSHLIDQALHLFGPVSQVYAELDSRRSGLEVDDDVFLALRHESGVRSHLWTNYLAAQSGPRLRVLGTRGAYVKHHPDLQEAALRAGRLPSEAGWGEEPPEHSGVFSDGEHTRPVTSQPGAYTQYYARVVATLRGEGPVPVEPGDAVAGLEIIEAARKSVAKARGA
jgi:scyllo-inositol 2-dehydrogenase (NADP+)